MVVSPHREWSCIIAEGFQAYRDEVVRCMVEGLVVHGAGGVVSTSPPIFSTADLRVAVAACLFDAERHRDVGVGVWDRQECTTFAF